MQSYKSFKTNQYIMSNNGNGKGRFSSLKVETKTEYNKKNKNRNGRHRNNIKKKESGENSRWGKLESENIFHRKQSKSRSFNSQKNTRFNSLRNENKFLNNRHRGGGRKRFPKKRSKEEFMKYMQEKHNSTQKKPNILAFVKTVDIKQKDKTSKKQKKKEKLIEKKKKHESFLMEKTPHLEKEEEIENNNDSISNSVKNSILAQYNYESFSEEDDENEESSEKETMLPYHSTNNSESTKNSFEDML